MAAPPDGSYVVMIWETDYTMDNEGPLPVVGQFVNGEYIERFNPFDLTAGVVPVTGGHDHVARWLAEGHIEDIFTPRDMWSDISQIGSTVLSTEYEGGWISYTSLLQDIDPVYQRLGIRVNEF